jgi:hypothetical protein
MGWSKSRNSGGYAENVIGMSAYKINAISCV